jgi:uncharacterized membrane protein (DUF4010 family)
MDAPSLELFYRFGVALVIGLLIGLQREYAFREDKERAGELLAGARTFPLISLLGAATAHYQRVRERETGLTTEIAALLSLAVGMLLLVATAAGMLLVV